MKDKDQNLIFEAYAKTLNEDTTGGILERLETFVRYNPDTARILNPILNELEDIAKTLGRVDFSILNKLSNTVKINEDYDNVADDYPDHEQILSNIREIVDENIGHGEGHEHSRETLDDIIDDLVRYRNGLPTADDYMRGGKL